MGVSYQAALKWLNPGLAHGAAQKSNGSKLHWDVPEAALQMKSPQGAAEEAGSATPLGRRAR